MSETTGDTPAAAGFGTRLYASWLQIAGCFAEVQTQILVTMVYAFAIGPMGSAAQLTRRDLLGKRGLNEDGSAWSKADTVSNPDLERAKRLF